MLSLILVLALLVSFTYIVFAEVNNEGVVLRPVVEYSSGDLRDPFGNLFELNKKKDEQNIQVSQEGVNPEVAVLSAESFKVQGVIWGGKFPQAIINNKILKVGDLIDGVEVMEIDKTGISLSSAGGIINLPAPGNAPVLNKENKEEK